MPTKLLMLLLCMLCAGTLSADFVGTVKFTVTGTDRKPLDSVKVTAAGDPWWGYGTQEEFEQYNKLTGPLAKVEASGEFTTDKTGVVEMKVSVKVSAEGKLPQHSVRVGGKWVKTDYVIVRLTLTKDGYRTQLMNQLVAEAGADENQTSVITVRRLSSYKAKLVHLSDRSPASNVKVQVEGKRDYSRDPRANLFQEVLTDAEGVLTLIDEQIPLQNMKLRMLDDKLAFAPNSAAWNSIQLRDGANDGGTLVVVPGGAIRVRSVHAETGADLHTVFLIYGTDPKAPFNASDESTSGECLIKGIPVGSHRLIANLHGITTLWPAEVNPVRVEAGKVTDLGDLKIEPQLTVEVFAFGSEGGGILQYTVSAEQISGYRPFTEGQRRDGKESGPWVRSSICTPERNKLDRMARGRWRIQVSAEGYSPGSIEVDLPTAEPVQVKLEQGGQLRISLDSNVFERSSIDAQIAISSTAPAMTALTGRSGMEVLSMIRTVDSTGVHISDSQTGNRGLGALAPGTYTVFGYTDFGTSLRADNVQVRKGEVTNLTLTNSGTTVTVRVTKQGKPLVHEVVYLVPPQGWGRPAADKQLNGRTDGQGVVVYNGVSAGKYELLTSRQHDWVVSGQGRRSLPAGMATQLELGYGDRVDVTLEADHSSYVWVSVQLKLAKGVRVIDVTLVNLYAQFGTHNTVTASTGDLYHFGPQLKTEPYELNASVSPDGRRQSRFQRYLQLTQPGEQRFEFEVALGRVEVKVKAPKGVNNNEVWVFLEHPNEMSWASNGGPVASGQADAKGVVVFENVPEGPYRVVAGATAGDLKEQGGSSHVTSEDFELKGTKKVSLKFDEKVGTLELQFDGFDHSIYSLPVYVELMNGDVPAKLGRPVTAFRQSRRLLIPSVAKGNYTLRVSAEGFEPFVQQNVEIETGLTTFLNVKLLRMCAVNLHLESAGTAAAQLRAAEIQFLDAAGAVIDLGRIDVLRTLELYVDGTASALSFTHVPAHCATIRIKATGYKTLNIEVKPQLATRYKTKATLERE